MNDQALMRDKHELLKRYLQGKATPHEAAVCERWLMEAPAVDAKSGIIASANSDTLINVLSVDTELNSTDLDELPGRLKQFHSESALDLECVAGLLDQAVEPGDLGRIGRHRITELIASSGMSLVFRGIDSQLRRSVCIKLLHPKLRFHAEAARRFEREAREVARLNHPRIVTVIDVGLQGDLPWLAMPFLDGMSMRDCLRRDGKLTSELAAHFLRQIAEGLACAHRHGLLHRDIKPENIWLTETDDIKILDFGLARPIDDNTSITQSGLLVGTPRYMSPEQIAGNSLDARSDLFSLGLLLLEMLTGNPPVQKGNLISTMLAVANEQIDVKKLGLESFVPSEILELAQELVQIEPARRIASADEVLRRLAVPNAVRASAAKSLESRQNRRRNGLFLLSGVLLSLFAGVLSWMVWSLGGKGTLVIEVHDPSIEVRLAGERMTILDPLTGKEYEVRIGENPLPSGVYQLEATSRSDGLTFSSQTIAIKRGEKTILSVSLQPSAGAGEIVQPIAAGESMTWAVPQFNKAELERIAKAIDVLPPLSLTSPDLFDGSNRLTRYSSVGLPLTLGDIKRWSLERQHVTQTRGVNSLERSPDRACSAHFGTNGFVEIRNSHGEATHHLPTEGFVYQIDFDPLDQNLVAFCCGSVNGKFGVEYDSKNGGVLQQEFQIWVWRLRPDRAELIRKFPSSTAYFTWDGNHRIAHYWQDKLVFQRIDTGEAFEFAGPKSERFPKVAISPDGRYLATLRSDTEESQIGLWDLKTGQFASAVPRIYDSYWNGEPQWKSDATEFAMLDANLATVDFWQPGNPSPVRQIDLPGKNDETRSGFPPSLRGLAIDQELNRLAWINKSNELVIRSLRNNRQGTCPLNAPNNGEPFELEWRPDGKLEIRSGLAAFIWEPATSEVDGRVSPMDPLPLEPKWEFTVSEVGRNGENLLLNWRLPSLRVEALRLMEVDELVFSSLGIKPTYDNSAEVANFAPEYDLVTGIPRDPTRNEYLKHSPNGLFTLMANIGTRTVQLRLRNNLARNDSPMHLGEFEFDQSSNLKILWTANSEYVAVVGRGIFERTGTKHRNGARFDFIFRASDGGRVELSDQTTTGRFLAGSGFASENQFYLVNGSEFWTIDPKSGESRTVTIQDGSEKNVGEFVGVHGDFWIFNRKTQDFKAADGKTEIDASVVISRFRLEDSSLKLVDSIQLPGSLDGGDGTTLQPQLSRDASLVAWVHIDGQVTVADRTRYQKLYFARWEDLVANKSINDFHEVEYSRFFKSRWHPNNDTFAWEGSVQNIKVLNGKTNQIKTTAIGHSVRAILPSKSGWIIAGECQLTLLSADGAYLGSIYFDSGTFDQPPSNAVWISADGELASKLPDKQLRIIFVKEDQVFSQRLDEFERAEGRVKLKRTDRVFAEE